MIEPQNGYTEKSFGSPIIRPEREKPPIAGSVTPEIKEYVANELAKALNPVWLELARLSGDIEEVPDQIEYKAGRNINIIGDFIHSTATSSSSSGTTTAEITWATVVRGLRYATTSPVDAGYDEYIVRLVSDTATAYSAGTTYGDGDTVYYDAETPPDSDPIVYTSLQDANTGNTPGSSPAYWDAEDQVVPLAIAVTAAGYNVEADLRTTLRWYNVGDVVPLYLDDGDYYFAQLFIPCTDSDGYGSLAWNEDEFRAMAVYK